MIATTTQGVVTNRGPYRVPVIKPDLALPECKVAIELDHLGRYNRHDDEAGAEDDVLRDLLLADLGWRTLRIRRPDQVKRGDWPWRIETNTDAPRKLAALVTALLIGSAPN